MHSEITKLITPERDEDTGKIEFCALLNGQLVGYYQTKLLAQVALDDAALALIALYARSVPQDLTEAEALDFMSPEALALADAFLAAHSEPIAPEDHWSDCPERYNLAGCTCGSFFLSL
jgi:hypothetical protein